MNKLISHALCFGAGLLVGIAFFCFYEHWMVGVFICGLVSVIVFAMTVSIYGEEPQQ